LTEKANELHSWLHENETSGCPDEVKKQTAKLNQTLLELHALYEGRPIESLKITPANLYAKYLKQALI
jgi:hypothetical protein